MLSGARPMNRRSGDGAPPPVAPPSVPWRGVGPSSAYAGMPVSAGAWNWRRAASSRRATGLCGFAQRQASAVGDRARLQEEHRRPAGQGLRQAAHAPGQRIVGAIVLRRGRALRRRGAGEETGATIRPAHQRAVGALVDHVQVLRHPRLVAQNPVVADLMALAAVAPPGQPVPALGQDVHHGGTARRMVHVELVP